MGGCRLQKRVVTKLSFKSSKSNYHESKSFHCHDCRGTGWTYHLELYPRRNGKRTRHLPLFSRRNRHASCHGGKFETESGIPLPTLEEMEETFKNFGLIKASLTAQLEVIDSTSHSMVFKTKKIPFKRLSSISESMKTEREITYGTLIWNISWQQSVYNGSYQCPVVSATGTIEFSPEMQRLGYFTSNNRNFCSIRGTELYITFECQINYSRSHFNFAYSDWVHPGFRPYR